MKDDKGLIEVTVTVKSPDGRDVSVTRTVPMAAQRRSSFALVDAGEDALDDALAKWRRAPKN